MKEKEVMLVILENLKAEDLNGIYKDIAENMGVEIAKIFYIHYKGLQFTFPVRFLSKEYVKNKIKNEYDGNNIKLLAKKYQYSERWIREVISTFDLIRKE